MTTKFNYSYFRSRLKVEDVSKIPGAGTWLTVSQAAKYFGVSMMTIRYRYLKGGLNIIKYKNIIYINIIGKDVPKEWPII